MTTSVAVETSAQIPVRERRRALLGSAVGSAVEWYDFFLYGTMSALVFGPLFFPTDDPASSQLLSLASFALAFLIRPIGGIIFSHIGDRIGRKRTLVVTLSTMGAATTLIGLLPTHAAIGVWAPALLTGIRLVQGLALGGEWGGGLLLAVEYAPAAKRGLFGSVPQIGALIGLALGNFAASGSNAIFSSEAFLSYGWRIPFLLSVILVAIGLWIRHSLDETPSFRRVMTQHSAVKVPLVQTFRSHWRRVLIVIGAKFIETSTFFLYATFSVSYAISTGYSSGEALNAVLAAAVIGIPVMLIFGRLSDRVGRKPVFIVGAVAAALFTPVYFTLIGTGEFVGLLVAIVIGFGIIWPSYGAVLGTLFAESFPPEVRYTGASLGYQIGAALVGGPAPLIATALISAHSGHWTLIPWFFAACALVSIAAVACAPGRVGRALDD